MKAEGKSKGRLAQLFFILHPSSFIPHPHPSGLEKVLKSKIGVRCDMKPYGTYQRFAYQTAPLPAINLDGVWPALRALALALALTALIVAGMLATLAVVPLVMAGIAALTAAVVGMVTAAVVTVVSAATTLVALALPAVLKLLAGALVIAVFGWVTYPRPRSL